MNHLTSEAAARWVSGLTDGPEAEQLEAHVLECAQCAQLLRREAVAEQALVTVAQRRPARRSLWLAVVPALAAAAALVIAIRPLPLVGSAADAGFPLAVTPVGPSAVGALLEVPLYEGSTPHQVLSEPAAL